MSNSDGIELELDGGPTTAVVPRTTRFTPTTRALATGSDDGYLSHPLTALDQIRACRDLATLADVCASFKTLPPDVRAPLRDAYRERAAMIRSSAVLAPGWTENAPATTLDTLAAIAAEGADMAIATQATRGVVGLTAADVNPVANMASAQAQAAVQYLDGHQTLGVSITRPADTALPEGYQAGDFSRAHTEAMLARQAAARGRIPRLVAAVQPADAGTLTRSSVVAGAAAEGHGVLVSWNGKREMTRGVMVAIADEHGVEPLKAHTTRHYIGTCVQEYNQRGYVARSSTRVKVPGESWLARWVIGTPDFSEATESIGSKVLTITLENDESITYTRHATDGAAVEADIRAEFNRLTGTQVYAAGKVTEWIAGVLARHHAAIGAWGGYFIRRAHAAAAEAFCSSVKASGWGHWTGLPALPIATSAQLLAGLSNGLIEECNAILGRVAVAQKEAEAKGRSTIGAARAAGLLTECDKVADKLTAHAELLGEAHVTDVRRCIGEVRELLRGLTDATSMRFANIADELAHGR